MVVMDYERRTKKNWAYSSSLTTIANLSGQIPDFFIADLPCTRTGQHHKDSGNLDYKLQLEIWKGNLGGALEMAANSKQLTEWLVSLSPLGNIHVQLYLLEFV